MKVLLTGIRGFVGQNLSKALANEHEIIGLSRIADRRQAIYSWDDFNNERVPAVDAIIHLAAIVHDTKSNSRTAGKSEKEYLRYFNANTVLTQNVYDYFCRHDEISKFIFFSSIAVDKNRATAYGESKALAENYISKNLSQAEGRSVYILRPCMIHGPGDKGNLNLLYNVIKKGLPWPLGAFYNNRSYASIDNVSYIISKILSLDIPSDTYNVADDTPLSTNELIVAMCEALEIKARIWRFPKSVVRATAAIGDRLKLPLNSDRLQKLTDDCIVNNDKIKKALNIDKLPISSRDGILYTIRHFDRNGQ